MVNGFYNTDKLDTKEKVEVFIFKAILSGYQTLIQEKYRNNYSGGRTLREDSSVSEMLAEIMSKKDWQLGVINRDIYNQGAIKGADGEIVLHADWLFIYVHMTLDNLNKLVKEYDLELQEW